MRVFTITVLPSHLEGFKLKSKFGDTQYGVCNIKAVAA